MTGFARGLTVVAGNTVRELVRNKLLYNILTITVVLDASSMFVAANFPGASATDLTNAGNLYAHARDFDPTRLFRGSGVGVSTITPLGPLGLDYAYGFDRLDAAGRPAPTIRSAAHRPTVRSRPRRTIAIRTRTSAG